MEFSQLKLHQKILDALKDQGYTTPSPIQEQAIPPALEGKDILGCAQTGTGKTAAFAIPIIERLLTEQSKGQAQAGAESKKASKRPIRALILTPTRELALQIHESFLAYGKYTSLKYGVLIGGVSQSGQVRDLNNGVDVLIATPGRLLDLLYQGYIEITTINVFVLDEADRMLDMGFFDDVKKTIELLPVNRQTLFFTATIPPQIKKLADTLLSDPVHVTVTPVSSTVELTTQYVYLTDKFKKLDLLIWHLKNKAPSVQCLVFSKTKHGAEKLMKKLNDAGIRAKALHGDKSQEARQTALSSFKNGSLKVLVATDIAARGIDIDSLPLVVNYDLPNVPETYVHRIGRTGRAGKEGVAVSFCEWEEKKYLADIEKLINKKITVIEDNPFQMEVFQNTSKPQKQRPPRRPFGNGQNQNGNPQKQNKESKPAQSGQNQNQNRPQKQHNNENSPNPFASYKKPSNKDRRIPKHNSSKPNLPGNN